LSAAQAPSNGGASEFIAAPDSITIPELPASAFADTSLYSDGKTLMEHAREFSGTAVVVLSRSAGEHADLDVRELQLTAEEIALLDSVCGSFDDVVLLLNCANTLEVGFVRDYPQIKSVLWVGFPGESGNLAAAAILSGAVNPSGRTVDIYPADFSRDPAFVNFGDYRYSNISRQNASGDGCFVQYEEGIYVGYRYYETRYEDRVLGQGNAGGYDYAATVQFPFGYGLSYTRFAYSGFRAEREDGAYTVTVTVTNTGDVAGKEVVQVYAQKPYTDYDRRYGIEKASVELVGFEKTALLEPGGSETVTVTVGEERFKSYDANNAKTFIIDEGVYLS
ncbi:hypothetical protein GAG84_28215, partial [Bacteroides thetaiotaomicron]